MKGLRKNPFAKAGEKGDAGTGPGGPTTPAGAPEATPGQAGRPRLKALRGEAGKAVAGVMAGRLRGMKKG